MKRFHDKVVLVTGGSRNTGLAIVDLFLREGAKVYFCGSTQASTDAGEKVLSERGLSAYRGVACDVGNSEQVSAMMDVIDRESGRLDVVVSNAANLGNGQGPTIDVAEEAFSETLNVNLGGTLRIVQQATRRFFLRQEANPLTGQKGVVVCIGSNTAQHVQRNHISYCTSKGGLESMVKCFAADLGPLGVRVNLLEPGYIWSDRWLRLPDAVKAKRRANTLTGRESAPANVAEAVAFLSSDVASTFQGAVLKMDSGATVALYPSYGEDRIPLPEMPQS